MHFGWNSFLIKLAAFLLIYNGFVYVYLTNVRDYKLTAKSALQSVIHNKLPFISNPYESPTVSIAKRLYQKKNVTFAYAFYATSDSHACAAIVAAYLIDSFRIGSSKHIDKIVIYRDISQNYIQDLFPKHGIIAIESSTLESSSKLDQVQNDGYYRYSVDKLKIFKLESYDRIIYLDVDSLVMKNLDHLFLLPPNIEIAAPWAYWENEPCITSALLVITPNNNTYNKLVDHWNGKIGKPGGPHADMDILNYEFGHSLPNNKGRMLPTMLVLPSQYLILSSDLIYTEPFHDRNHLLETTYVIHFSAGGKPWNQNAPNVSPRDKQHADKQFHQIFETWKNISSQVCFNTKILHHKLFAEKHQ